jgi:hypothetical protein
VIVASRSLGVVREVWKQFQLGMERGDPGAWFDSELIAGDVPVELSLGMIWEFDQGHLAPVRVYLSFAEAPASAGAAGFASRAIAAAYGAGTG